MLASIAKTVWSNQERTRHFLIPDETKLPPGDFVLRTVIGRQMEVQEEAARAYEVSREEAKAWLSNQMAGMVGHVKDALMKFLAKDPGNSQGTRPDHEASRPDPTGDRKSAAARRAVEHLSATERDALEEKARSLSAAIKEIGAVVDTVRTGDAAEIDAARLRICALRQRLEAQGIPVSPSIDELPIKLRDFFNSLKSARDAGEQASRLEEMADLVEDIAHRIAQAMRDAAHRNEVTVKR
jgi:hypothetical protein